MSALQNLVMGNTLEVLCPSGRLFLIREQNGNDDDLLQNPTTQKDLSNFDYFLESIIVHEILPDGTKKNITLADVKKFLLRDRSYLLITSRVHSIGNTVKFKFDWTGNSNSEGEFEYEEDMTIFLWDYTKPFPAKDSPEYLESYIEPYPEKADDYFIFQINSGKKFRFKLLNRESELYLLGLKSESVTKNEELKSRKLQFESDGKWVDVENFSMFSKKEMIEIHSSVLEIDQPLRVFSELTHPKTGEKFYYPVLADTNFFFPVEI